MEVCPQVAAEAAGTRGDEKPCTPHYENVDAAAPGAAWTYIMTVQPTKRGRTTDRFWYADVTCSVFRAPGGAAAVGPGG